MAGGDGLAAVGLAPRPAADGHGNRAAVETAPPDLLRRDLACRPDLFHGGAAGRGLEELVHLPRLGPVVPLVDDDHGAQCAGADAVDGFEAVLPILRRLAGPDLEAAADLVEDAGAPRTWQAVPRQTFTVCLPLGVRLKAL